MKNITRYMSLEKCLDVLTNQRLYISRFDSFDDQLEGFSLNQLAEKAKIEIADLGEERSNKLDPSDRKKMLFASCWFGGRENLSMWDRYRSERGLALSIDMADLEQRFGISIEDSDFTFNYENVESAQRPAFANAYFGKVNYISPDTKKRDKAFRLGLIKHSAFSYENEFRFVIRQQGKRNQLKATSIIWHIPDFSNLEWTIISNPFMDSTFHNMIRSYIKSLKLENVAVSTSKYRSLFEK